MPLPRPREGCVGALILSYLELLGPCSQQTIFDQLTNDYRRHDKRLPATSHLRRMWLDYVDEGWIVRTGEDQWAQRGPDAPVMPLERTLPDAKIPYHYEDLPDDYLALHDAGLYGPQPVIHTLVPRSSHAEFFSTERTRKTTHINKGAN